jgi:hypothetical protein
MPTFPFGLGDVTILLMGTWVGALVETQGRPDFWDGARTHGVRPLVPAVPQVALINCEIGLDFQASIRLAEALSRDLATMALAFVAQTAADAYELQAFARGVPVRRLAYSRDDGGWLQVEGTPQPWERAFFFDDVSTAGDDGQWPDMICDDLSEEDLARYEDARRAGDATRVMDLLHPSSMEPLLRVCAFFDVTPDSPAGEWKKRSVWSRLRGRSG